MPTARAKHHGASLDVVDELDHVGSSCPPTSASRPPVETSQSLSSPPASTSLPVPPSSRSNPSPPSSMSVPSPPSMLSLPMAPIETLGVAVADECPAVGYKHPRGNPSEVIEIHQLGNAYGSAWQRTGRCCAMSSLPTASPVIFAIGHVTPHHIAVVEREAHYIEQSSSNGCSKCECNVIIDLYDSVWVTQTK